MPVCIPVLLRSGLLEGPALSYCIRDAWWQITYDRQPLASLCMVSNTSPSAEVCVRQPCCYLSLPHHSVPTRNKVVTPTQLLMQSA